MKKFFLDLACRFGLHVQKRVLFSGVGSGYWCGAFHIHGGYVFDTCDNCGDAKQVGEYYRDELSKAGEMRRKIYDSQLPPHKLWRLCLQAPNQEAFSIAYPRRPTDMFTVIPLSNGSAHVIYT